MTFNFGHKCTTNESNMDFKWLALLSFVVYLFDY